MKSYFIIKLSNISWCFFIDFHHTKFMVNDIYVSDFLLKTLTAVWLFKGGFFMMLNCFSWLSFFVFKAKINIEIFDFFLAVPWKHFYNFIMIDTLLSFKILKFSNLDFKAFFYQKF